MHDLSLYLLEMLENSTRAGATHIDVALVIDHAGDELRLAVDDDGSGLTVTPKQILDPFYTTKPGKKTGLGLSLLKADAQAAGGDLTIGPSPALGGVRVEAFMRLSNLDRPPLGDLAASIVVTAVTNPEVTFTVSLQGDEFDPPLEHAPPVAAAARLQRLTEELVTSSAGLATTTNDGKKGRQQHDR